MNKQGELKVLFHNATPEGYVWVIYLPHITIKTRRIYKTQKTANKAGIRAAKSLGVFLLRN